MHIFLTSEEWYEALLSDVDEKGVKIFGDGRTMVRTPRMNILVILDIVDCRKQMMKGGKKDPTYVDYLARYEKNLIPTKTELMMLL